MRTGTAPRPGAPCSSAGTVHAFRNASGRPARQLVIGPPDAIDLITELGEHPRDRWEKVHERHRSHYAHAQHGGRRSGHTADMGSLPPRWIPGSLLRDWQEAASHAEPRAHAGAAAWHAPAGPAGKAFLLGDLR
jgi:hypothetical protein